MNIWEEVLNPIIELIKPIMPYFYITILAIGIIAIILTIIIKKRK